MDPKRLALGAARRLGRAGGLALDRAGVTLKQRGLARPRQFPSVQELAEHHFSHWSSRDHINRRSLTDALIRLEEKPAVILETGSSAWGTNSSQLFDAYVANFGGDFWTVDLRVGPSRSLRPIVSPRTTLVTGDSVRFIERWVRDHRGLRADLVYLDS